MFSSMVAAKKDQSLTQNQNNFPFSWKKYSMLISMRTAASLCKRIKKEQQGSLFGKKSKAITSTHSSPPFVDQNMVPIT